MLQSKFVITVFALIVSLSSCVTEKACFRKFPVQSDTVKIVITRDSLVYRDTVLYITLPAVVQVDSIVIPCPPPPPGYVPDTAYAETDFAKAQAWFSYPSIVLRLDQKESILEVRLDSALMEAYHWKTEYEKITQVRTVTRIPILYKVSFWMLLGMFVLISFMVLWRILRK